MKLFLIGAILIFSIYSCDRNNFLITENRAGEFSVKMNKNEVLTLLNSYKRNEFHTKDGSPNDFTIYNFTLKDSLKYSAAFRNDKLMGLRVYDSQYTTSEKIRIGMTAAQITEKGYFLSMKKYDIEGEYLCYAFNKDKNGVVNTDEHVMLIMKGPVYREGERIEPAGNSVLKCFLIGDYFISESLSNSDNEIYGKVINRQYENNIFDFYLPIDSEWIIIENNSKIKNAYNAISLKYKQSDLIIDIMFEDLKAINYTKIKDGFDYLYLAGNESDGTLEGHDDIYRGKKLYFVESGNNYINVPVGNLELTDFVKVSKNHAIHFKVQAQTGLNIQPAIDLLKNINFVD